MLSGSRSSHEIAFAAVAVIACQPSAAHQGSAPNHANVAPSDDCAPITDGEGPRLTALRGSEDGTWEFPIVNDPRGPHGPGDPASGETYVAFDTGGRLGVVEVGACARVACYDCSSNWACAARWLSGPVRPPDNPALVSGVGPTHERWERLHVLDLDPPPPSPPCPENSICVDSTATRYLGWKTVLMLDLDGDGQPDIALRRRDTCGPKRQLEAAELRVRDDRRWRVVYRTVQEPRWAFDNPREIPGDDTFPPMR
jgi:hypothetical protein